MFLAIRKPTYFNALHPFRHRNNSNINKADKKKEKLKNVLGNNYTEYFHWLPKTNFFLGGFLNFRKLTTQTEKEFGEKFNPPKIQISPFFVKDIIARFSSYYARQGQPY